MDELLIVFLAGFFASFVDGALGMGFGPASSSILLGTGLSPAAVSTTVNLAKVATGMSSAVSHWRFQNIDRRLVRRLAVPGCIGALIGVTVLASVDGEQLKPVLTVVLLVMAARILLRFSRPLPVKSEDHEPAKGQRVEYDERGTVLAATAGGVTNGLVGAWGPVVTTFLLQKGVTPRYAVGSVNTAEVAVALVASGSLLASVGGGGVNPAIVAAMLAGGILAAPVAAWAVRFIPARGLGVAVGGLLFVTNIRQLSESLGLGGIRWAAYGLVFVACGFAAMGPRLALRRAAAAAAG
ncbi:MAG TPA: sulfite exporter TauE/SafE family protein [Actinomycetota bacterium]|nr:sulfite exporter TauE/SafE family protein [Actinomycetota bacterium]